jgi:hypothetical protein
MFGNLFSSQPIVCRYCQKMGHKVPKYYKKKKDALNQKQHGNYDPSKDPLYLFTIISKPQHHSHQWFLSSDLNQHMSPLKNIFRNYTLLDNLKTIFLGDNSSYQALGYGSILMQTSYSQNLIIHNVLYVFGLAKNLLSIPQTTITSKIIVTFTNVRCIITTTSPFHHQNVMRIDKKRNLFPPNFGIELDFQKIVASCFPQLDFVE